jgi:hypothetical protein
VRPAGCLNVAELTRHFVEQPAGPNRLEPPAFVHNIVAGAVAVFLSGRACSVSSEILLDMALSQAFPSDSDHTLVELVVLYKQLVVLLEVPEPDRIILLLLPHNLNLDHHQNVFRDQLEVHV